MTDEVLYEVDGRVATLTLNRPDQRNAVNPELAVALEEATDRFEADDDVWVRQTEDAAEGPRAFAEKRAPRWTGR